MECWQHIPLTRHLFLLAIALAKFSRQHPVFIKLVSAGFCRLANTIVFMSRSPNIANKLVLHTLSLCSSDLAFFSMYFIRVQAVQLFNSTDSYSLEEFPFYLIRFDFHMANEISIAVNVLQVPMLTMLSVDEILLPRHMKWSIDCQIYPDSFPSLKKINLINHNIL